MKKETLRAFRIENSDFLKSESGLHDLLMNKLTNSSSVEVRRMNISSAMSNPEQDLISYYDINTHSKGALFCTMLRIGLGNNIQSISETLLIKELFTLQEIKSEKLENGALYKSHYYFCILGDILVTNLQGNITISRLQTYLSWLLGELFEVTPMIEDSVARTISDIKQIVVQDPSSQKARVAEKSITGIGIAKVLKLMKVVKEVSEIELETMISAKLIVEFNKPSKDDSSSMQRVYGALLKPISDLENFTIVTRDNKSIVSGKDMLKTKVITVDTSEDGENINEKNLFQEMLKYILEIQNEKNTLY